MSELSSSTAPGIRDLLDENPLVGVPRTGVKRFWTGREEKLLRLHFPQGGVPACLPVLPGRTASSIYQRAGQLGLRSPVTIRRGCVPRQRWSGNDQIDTVIRAAYQRTPTKGDISRLARTVGRPRWWVSKRASALGLVTPRFKQPPWSEAEIEIVAEAAHRDPTTIRRTLARAGFTRTETAISVKLKREGVVVGRDADPDHYTATGLAKLLGIDAKGVTAWIIKGWLKAERRGTARVEAQGGDEWWIRRRDVRRFVVDNAAAIDLRKVEKFWFIDLLGGPAT